MNNRATVLYLFMILYFMAFFVGGREYEYSVRICYFGKHHSEGIYRIYCELNCATTFILPDGQSVSEVIEPTGDWRVNSDNKRFIYVVPDKKGIHTSIDIISKQGNIYSFILEEIAKLPGEKRVIKQVKIKNEDKSFFRLGKTKKIEEKSKVKTGYVKKFFSRYRIRDRFFFVSKVWDDRVFTYINMEKSQIRPALFLRKKRGGAVLEVVRYVDDAKRYTVHRVLEADEYFVLKFGKKESVIGRY